VDASGAAAAFELDAAGRTKIGASLLVRSSGLGPQVKFGPIRLHLAP
jgi:hypothetical protein